MSETKSNAEKSVIRSAADLRMAMLEKQMEQMKKAERKRDIEKRTRDEFVEKFLKEHLTEQERNVIRKLVRNAVEQGRFEAMIYSFPCDLTTDYARAINNEEPDWPATLQGKAKDLYDRFKTVIQPEGYKLKAMVIDFDEEGKPGHVGFFLNWE